MDTTTTYGRRVEPPPDPLWFPGAEWFAEAVELREDAHDGGGGTGGDDGGAWFGLQAGSQAEGRASGSEDREELDSGNAHEESVFFADRTRARVARPGAGSGLPKGLSGSLVLRSAASLDQELTGSALQGLRVLDSWAAAARARLIHRQHKLMVEELEQFNRERAAQDAASGRAAVMRGVDRALAFTLAATEIATMLGIPEGTAKALVDESDELCERCPNTLALLERAEITPAQARTILDQTRSLVAEEMAPGAALAMEQALLKLAPGLTNAQLLRKARRLRERSYPETIQVRHQTAFEQRRVWFQPQPDGMGHLTAYLPAAKGQSIFGALTGAARGEQLLGDPRCLDQLRTDILASLLLHTPEPWISAPDSCHRQEDGPNDGSGTGEDSSDTTEGSSGKDHRGGSRRSDGFDVPRLPSGTVPEIMVLINADTLFGADDAPAELAGYGPISAQDARRLARTACRWTGLAQDPQTGQILGVGRRRKVPAGLRRWLQARDQTCRFPGCSTGTARTEADHTVPWAHGGPTEHWNLANLCKRHHRMKTLGHWKAQQVSPGVLEWISPLGRRYQTQPELTLGSVSPPSNTGGEAARNESPPPF